MELISTTAFIALVTFVVTIFSFGIALRSEFRKNLADTMSNKLIDERRHNANEQRLALLEERYALAQDTINFRLDEIRAKVNLFSEQLIKHLQHNHE